MKSEESMLLNQAPDMDSDFAKMENTHFFAASLQNMEAQTLQGALLFERYAKKVRYSLNASDLAFEPTKPWEFPAAYPESPALPFSISFVSQSAVRIRFKTTPGEFRRGTSLMIPGEIPPDTSWEYYKRKKEWEWQSPSGSVILRFQPFQLIFKDSRGDVLTQTYHSTDNKSLIQNKIPLSFVRSFHNMQNTIAASFTLSPGEAIFGCGESFTALNKRGQRLNLWTKDPHGVQNRNMYKPVPFFMSSRGYGMFMHTSAPLTLDIGHTFDDLNTIYAGDEELDLFFFFGQPKEVLREYTALTGRSPVPPLWSFGLWMSRITYKSELEVREVAARLREYRIPCDVIHLDTGWFENNWCCNYEFSATRFNNPKQMIADLKEQGYRVSLWQLPYYTPANELYRELVEQGLAVRGPNGGLPTEDAILDFSNPRTIVWYKKKLAALLKLGVAAIKADFGEAAPLHGLYHSGQSGFYEHNLYPLRYNHAVDEVTREENGEALIWARSAWAGSQRYPIHWGGDAENTDSAMAATLRGGLSLGLSGFSFWSHDIGGFVRRSPEELYRRWLPFGMLTSHSRCHGAPPKEPWEYGDAFVKLFRDSVRLKYRLMPYMYTQAHLCSQQGLPMLRALFLEYPEDRTAWTIDDSYLLGSDLLVAPLLEEKPERGVYLPEGEWIDFQTEQAYDGARWHTIPAGHIPIVLLVKAGSIIPQAPDVEHTGQIDWNQVIFRAYPGVRTELCKGLFYHPVAEAMHTLSQ